MLELWLNDQIHNFLTTSTFGTIGYVTLVIHQQYISHVLGDILYIINEFLLIYKEKKKKIYIYILLLLSLLTHTLIMMTEHYKWKS